MELPNKVNKQGSDGSISDYFSQVFKIDYDRNTSTVKSFTRDVDDSICSVAISDITRLSNQSAFEFIETNALSNILQYYRISFPDNIMLYTKNDDGTSTPCISSVKYSNNLISAIEAASDTEYELVPFYDDARRILIAGTSLATDDLRAAIMKELQDMKIYGRENIELADDTCRVFYDGKLISLDDDAIESGKELFIYITDYLTDNPNGITPAESGCISEDSYPYRANTSSMFVNYTNPYNDVKNASNALWHTSDSTEFCIYQEDSDSNAYYEDGKLHINANEPGIDIDITDKTAALNTSIREGYASDNAATAVIRKNLLNFVDNSTLPEKESTNTVSVSNETAFIYVISSEETITVDIDSAAGYSYVIDSSDARNGKYRFIILPVWGDHSTSIVISNASAIYSF